MHVYTQLGNMAEALKVSGEKYRRIFSEYVPVFVDMVSSAALSCNLNVSLKREQIQFFSEISSLRDWIGNNCSCIYLSGKPIDFTIL